MVSTQACRLTIIVGVVVLVGYVLIVSGDSDTPIALRKLANEKGSKIINSLDANNDDEIKGDQKAKRRNEKVEKEEENTSLEKMMNIQKQEVEQLSRRARKISQMDDGGNELMFPGDLVKLNDLKKEAAKVKSNLKGKSDHSGNEGANKINKPGKAKPPRIEKHKSRFDVAGDVQKMEQIMKVKQPVKLKKGKKKPRIPKPKIVPEQKLSAEDRNSLDVKLRRSFGPNYKKSKHYQSIVKKCSEYKHLPGRILFYDVSPYIETQPHLCDGSPDILLAVHTRPYNFQRRQLIRDTFGSMRYVKGKRIILAFFIGRPRNEKIGKQIQQEARDYRDIVQRDFKEHYRNMTYKHLTVMDWIMEYCSNVKYLVKVDDDVFVNIFQVIDYIESFNPQSFYCTRTSGPKPMRKSGKWKVTYEEYSRTTFPPYCMGYAYLMKASLAKELYWCSVYSKFLWIDDVLVGGLLPEKLRIHLTRFISGHDSAYLLPSHASWKIADHMFLLGTRNELLPSVIRKIWRSSLQFSY